MKSDKYAALDAAIIEVIRTGVSFHPYCDNGLLEVAKTTNPHADGVTMIERRRTALSKSGRIATTGKPKRWVISAQTGEAGK